MPGKATFEVDAAAPTVLPLVLEVVVEVSDHVLDGLVSPLWVEGVLDGVCRLYHVVDVYP